MSDDSEDAVVQDEMQDETRLRNHENPPICGICSECCSDDQYAFTFLYNLETWSDLSMVPSN